MNVIDGNAPDSKHLHNQRWIGDGDFRMGILYFQRTPYPSIRRITFGERIKLPCRTIKCSMDDALLTHSNRALQWSKVESGQVFLLHLLPSVYLFHILASFLR